MSEFSLSQRITAFHCVSHISHFYSLFLKHIIFSSIFKLLIIGIHYNTNSETRDKIHIWRCWRLRIMLSAGIWTQTPLKLASAHLHVVECRFAIHQQSFHDIFITSMIHPVLKQVWWTGPWRGPSLSHTTKGAQTTRSGWMLCFGQTPQPLLHLLSPLSPQQQPSAKGKAWRPAQRRKQAPEGLGPPNLKSHI